MNIKPFLLKLWNFWPPFLGPGIKVIKKSVDFRYMKVMLKLRFYNANYVGTAYGGSIYSMTDPFYMIMLLKNLGKEYIIWDKEAHIKFLKPGTSDLYSEFILTEEDLNEIRSKVEEQGKYNWSRKVEIYNTNKELVAFVEKIVNIRKKV